MNNFGTSPLTLIADGNNMSLENIRSSLPVGDFSYRSFQKISSLMNKTAAMVWMI